MHVVILVLDFELCLVIFFTLLHSLVVQKQKIDNLQITGPIMLLDNCLFFFLEFEQFAMRLVIRT